MHTKWFIRKFSNLCSEWSIWFINFVYLLNCCTQVLKNHLTAEVHSLLLNKHNLKLKTNYEYTKSSTTSMCDCSVYIKQ